VDELKCVLICRFSDFESVTINVVEFICSQKSHVPVSAHLSGLDVFSIVVVVLSADEGLEKAVKLCFLGFIEAGFV
jgi:hypothetical protein